MEKPRTEAQINASRANGARSHGPITEDGKANSSRNAMKHGLTARAILLPSEDPEKFEELLAGLATQFDAATDVEMLCLEEMAVALWKQRRIWTLEATTLRLGLDARAAHQELENADAPAEACYAWSGAQKTLADFSWHDVRLQRQYSRALNNLERLQAARKAKRKSKKMENEPEPFPQPEAA